MAGRVWSAPNRPVRTWETNPSANESDGRRPIRGEVGAKLAALLPGTNQASDRLVRIDPGLAHEHGEVR